MDMGKQINLLGLLMFDGSKPNRFKFKTGIKYPEDFE